MSLTINKFIEKLNDFTTDPTGKLAKDVPAQLRKFWWDRVILILLYLLLVFFAIDVVAEGIARYFGNSFHIECLTDSSFIETYCREDLPDFAKYFELIVFSEIVAFLALQYFWNILCTGKAEHFLNSLKKLSFKRDIHTGEYNQRDFEILRKLQQRFSKPGRLYWTYLLLHLFPQLVIAVLYFAVNTVFRSDSIVFTCHNPGSGVWPQDDDVYVTNVTCIAPSITTLAQLQYINYIALGGIFLALLWGFYYILIVPGYAKKIALENVAKFVAFTGLRPEHFRNNRGDPCNWLFRRISQSDLQFLMLRLYATNRRSAELLKDLVIEKKVSIIKEEFCHCNEYHQAIKTKNQLDSEIIRSISSIAQSRKTGGRKLFGILVTHESESLAYILDKSSFDKMICFNFNPYIMEEDFKPEGLEFTPGLTHHHHSGVPDIMQLPSHVWSWDSLKERYIKVEQEVINNMADLIKDANEYELLVIITPISDKEFGRVHADHRVKHLLKCIPKAAKNTYILTYFPTSIGRVGTEEAFVGMRDRRGIPSFLHNVFMDEPNEHNEECNHNKCIIESFI